MGRAGSTSIENSLDNGKIMKIFKRTRTIAEVKESILNFISPAKKRQAKKRESTSFTHTLLFRSGNLHCKVPLVRQFGVSKKCVTKGKCVNKRVSNLWPKSSVYCMIFSYVQS